jgi:hypothetical protein
MRRRTQDLEEATENSEHAVRLTPVDHPDLAARLNGLRSMLASRYERTRQVADLDLAVSKTQEAVQLTPVNHVDLAK